jgi:hypothetical protein
VKMGCAKHTLSIKSLKTHQIWALALCVFGMCTGTTTDDTSLIPNRIPYVIICITIVELE